VVFEGKIHNLDEIKKLLGTDYRFRTECSGEALVYLYDKYRDAFLDAVNGKFAFALWDERSHRLLLGRDRLGIEPLFYCDDGKRLIFSSSLRALSGTGWVTKQLNYPTVLRYLLNGYSPADETFLDKVYKLPAGHILSCNGSEPSIKKYWHLSFAETDLKSEEEFREQSLSLLEDAIRIRLVPNGSPGAFLTGGTDSSAIVCLASKMLNEQIVTLSYRCDGVSDDESVYAKRVAQRCGTKHFEIRYCPEDLFLMSRAVEWMNEPFSDMGVEIAGYLLGHAAKGKTSYVLSGEGGKAILGSLATGPSVYSERLDYGRKRNYTLQELRELCSEEVMTHCEIDKMGERLFLYDKEPDKAEQLSAGSYLDYQAPVGFHLHRLGLLRAFGVESRSPLLDHRLVECAVKIPSRLKTRGVEDAKCVYNNMLEGLVPGEILNGRPKLAYNIPMKNWLRENGRIKEWIIDTLSDSCFKQRDLFRAGAVQRMVEEHMRKTHDHSNRLWGLMVLELWLREFFRGSGTESATCSK
jgi:asparagine synthase (glutamine-hydrolysing)